MESTLVNRCLTKEAKSNLICTLIFSSECRPGRQRNLSANYGMATQESEVSVEHMHRAALALGAARRFTKQLCHYRIGRHALGQGMTVFTITRQHVVVLTNS